MSGISHSALNEFISGSGNYEHFTPTGNDSPSEGEQAVAISIACSVVVLMFLKLGHFIYVNRGRREQPLLDVEAQNPDVEMEESQTCDTEEEPDEDKLDSTEAEVKEADEPTDEPTEEDSQETAEETNTVVSETTSV